MDTWKVLSLIVRQPREPGWLFSSFLRMSRFIMMCEGETFKRDKKTGLKDLILLTQYFLLIYESELEVNTRRTIKSN